jgi:Zn-dependent peptidase ImmA (M78 family)/DNA-binding XRE family transcriptional regulator
MKPLINIEMIVIARESRGETQLSLAEKTEIPQSTISKIEQGLLNPSEHVISEISSILNYSPNFFYEQGELCTPASIVYRKKTVLGKSELKKIEANASIVRMQVNKLVDFQGGKYLNPLLLEDKHNHDPLMLARELRERFQLGDKPLENLTAFLEELGIVVFLFDFGTDLVDGFHLSNKSSYPPIIFLNKTIPGDRMRFTLAHEFGHLLLHKIPSENLKEMEKQANDFASEFLLPTESLKKELSEKINLRLLAELKPKWRVSMSAILKKAEEIFETQYKHLWISMSRFGYLRNEPVSIDKESTYAVISLFSDFKSLEDVLKLLSFNKEDFQRLYSPSFPNSPKN